MKPKFFLIGFLLVVLIAVPLTIYLLTQQGPTNTKSSAAKATILAFPSPIPDATVGQQVDIPIQVNPSNQGSTNQVSLVKFAITYDGSKLQAASTYFTPGAAFSVPLEGPNNTCSSGSSTTPTPTGTSSTCTISATVSIPADPTKAVSSQDIVGTLHFTPISATDTNGTTISFVPNQNQVLSLAVGDQASENVLLSAQDGKLVINAGAGTTPTDTPTPTPGTTSPGGGTTGGTSGGSTSTPTGPTCTSITADKASSDTAPFTVLLTANGTATASISKVSINFGDGNVEDVTSGTGIGTTSIASQVSHVYKTTGTFTATATITDANGNISTPNSCSQVISIGQGTSPTPSPTPAGATPVTSVGPTGPGSTLVLAGVAGAVLVIAGLAILVF